MFDLALFAKPLAGHRPLMATVQSEEDMQMASGGCAPGELNVWLASLHLLLLLQAMLVASLTTPLLRNMVVFSVISPQWFYTQ